MEEIVVYVHGKGGSAQEAEHYKALFPDCEVIGFDYRAQAPYKVRAALLPVPLNTPMPTGAVRLSPYGTLQFVPGTSTGCSIIFTQKGIPKMEQLSVHLLLTAGILLLIAGVIFAILQVWLYTGLLWAGAFGCLMAALNFRNSKNDGG